jgi:hypothetical protein
MLAWSLGFNIHYFFAQISANFENKTINLLFRIGGGPNPTQTERGSENRARSLQNDVQTLGTPLPLF